MNDPRHQLAWKQLPDMPVGKWEPASLVRDEKLYVLGGYANHIVSSRRQDVFDPANSKSAGKDWRLAASLVVKYLFSVG